MHREVIGVVSGEDRSSIFTISAKSREKNVVIHAECSGRGGDRSGICSVSCGGIVMIIIVVYNVVHRGGDRSNIDTVSVSVPRT